MLCINLLTRKGVSVSSQIDIIRPPSAAPARAAKVAQTPPATSAEQTSLHAVVSFSGGAPAAAGAGSPAPSTSAHGDGGPSEMQNMMASTGIVYALLALRNVLTPVELNEQMAKSARFFEGTRDRAGRDFRELTFLMTGLLFPDNIPMGRRWLPCAKTTPPRFLPSAFVGSWSIKLLLQDAFETGVTLIFPPFRRSKLWRFVFLVRPDGSFDCTDGLALALNAHRVDDDDTNDCPLTCQARQSALRRRNPPPAFRYKCYNLLSRSLHTARRTPQVEAIRQSVPEMVFEGRDEESLGREGLEELKLRVWSTALALVVLEKSPFGWLAEPEESDATLVDRAEQWLKAQKVAAAPPARTNRGSTLGGQGNPGGGGDVDAAPPERGRAAQILEFARQIIQSAAAVSGGGEDDDDGIDIDKQLSEGKGTTALYKLAVRQLKKWDKIADDYVARIRAAETKSWVHFGTLIQKSSGEIIVAAMVKHETVRV